MQIYKNPESKTTKAVLNLAPIWLIYYFFQISTTFSYFLVDAQPFCMMSVWQGLTTSHTPYHIGLYLKNIWRGIFDPPWTVIDIVSFDSNNLDSIMEKCTKQKVFLFSHVTHCIFAAMILIYKDNLSFLNIFWMKIRSCVGLKWQKEYDKTRKKCDDSFIN